MTSVIDKKYRRSVFVVVYKKIGNERIYLVLKRKLHWRGYEFPKGGIENYETDMDAVKREVSEETGLKIKKIFKHEKSGKYKYKRKFPDRGVFSGQSYVLYSTEVEDGVVKIDKHEHSGFIWLKFQEANKILSKKNQKDCLRIVEFSDNNL